MFAQSSDNLSVKITKEAERAEKDRPSTFGAKSDSQEDSER
jgi:hypothetical protein